MSTNDMSTCTTLDDQLLDILMDAKSPLSPSEIQRKMNERGVEATPYEARKALWNLIGRGLASLTADMRVQAE